MIRWSVSPREKLNLSDWNLKWKDWVECQDKQQFLIPKKWKSIEVWESVLFPQKRYWKSRDRIWWLAWLFVEEYAKFLNLKRLSQQLRCSVRLLLVLALNISFWVREKNIQCDWADSSHGFLHSTFQFWDRELSGLSRNIWNRRSFEVGVLADISTSQTLDVRIAPELQEMKIHI